MKLLCPQCQSDRLSAAEKNTPNPLLDNATHFAGVIKNNKLMLTCLSCEHTFKTGEALQLTTGISEVLPNDSIEQLILKTIKAQGILETIKSYKNLTGVRFGEAKQKVETIAHQHGIEVKTKIPIGCYILSLLLIGLCFL